MKDTRNISNISLNWFFKLILVILTVVDTFPYLYTVIFFFLNRFWWPEEEIFLWTLVWTRLFPTLRIQFFFFSFCSSRERKSTVYWQNKHMQMCREWLAGVICLKTSCARVVRSAYKSRHEFQPHRVILDR